MKNWKILLFLVSMVVVSFCVLLLLGFATRSGFLDHAASSSALEDLKNYQIIDLRETNRQNSFDGMVKFFGSQAETET